MYETKGADLSSKAFYHFPLLLQGPPLGLVQLSGAECLHGTAAREGRRVQHCGEVLGFGVGFFTPAGLWSLPSQLDVNKTVYTGC